MPRSRPDADAEDARAKAEARLAIIDGDVHPALRSLADLKPYLSARWWDTLQTYGTRRRHGMNFEPYPEVGAARLPPRRLARETAGRPAATSISSARSISTPTASSIGILGPLGITGQSEINLDLRRRPRLGHQRLAARALHAARAAPERPPSSCPTRTARHRRSEIERCAADPAYAQVFMLTRTSEPAGNRRYWPIYEAAERHGLPVGAARVRRQRASLYGRRLALLLHRGRRRPFDLVPDGRHQPRHRGRVRALPEAQGRHRRRRLRLAARR